ncbi:MAG: ribonuclease H-like domain-containing protein, partial [Candidatus Acidiferrales bacterium]
MSLSAHDRFSRLAALRPPRQAEIVRETSGADFVSASPGLPDGAARLAEILGAAPSGNRFGEHLLLRKWYSEPSECTPEEAALRLLAPDAALEIANPREWIFLDTETTGLMGGTGTYAFLVGIAWWDAGGLQVEQFFLRDHSEEHSLLAALGERLAERRVLVTFNGKSFDWPLLETRYRMTRSVKAPNMRAHLDFLHPARNLWRM